MKNLILLGITYLFCLVGIAQQITLENFASGFSQPVDIKHAGDERLFVVEQGGVIKILNPDGSTNTTPFLDISSQISSGGERGLLGLAFHPDYANNGHFFLNFTLPNGNTQISRFSVSANPDIADANSRLDIIGYAQPFSNHNGGSINFDPDGFLVISSGDGGSGGDPQNNSQNTSNLLGKLLRIDIDNTVPGGANYTIPSSNPFANSTGNEAKEIWAYGLRNAWKFSYDRLTNDIWIADVGQNAREEINKMPGDEAGVNYGWRCYEGNNPFNTANCPDPSELTFPVAEYPHSQGRSITGGYVYRGTLYNNMEGLYFFADFVTGIFGYVDENNELTILDDLTPNWSTFAEDLSGELYLASYAGTIFKIIGENLVGIEDTANNTIGIYPNPAQNQVTLNSTKNALDQVIIYNLQGGEVLSINHINNTKSIINIEGIATGVYFVKATTVNGLTSNHKLIIK